MTRSAAIYRAATMDAAEKQQRISRMRELIAKRTIFDWSAALLRDLADVWERQHATWSA